MRQIIRQLILAPIVFFVFSCAPKGKIKNGEGFINVDGGKIWYRVLGEGHGTPIIMLHGGPGVPGYYFNPLIPLGNNRQVIMFDQLCCGRSDRITDTTLMNLEHYVEQVKQLVHALKINEFYLFGHSWGTTLGTDYYLKYPDGVKAIILASPCLSTQLWMRDADTLISTLPDSVQLVLKQSVQGIVPDSAKLNSAFITYFSTFYNRKQPMSADMDSSIAQAAPNIYQYMWGNSEFVVSGTLKDYDRTSQLNKFEIPTLYITGEFDAVRPSTARYYQKLTPHSKLVIIKDAGHMTMQDKPEESLKEISTFLNELENNN